MTTDRLLLRPLEGGDLPAFVAYRRDPDVARYQSWSPTYTQADGTRLLDEQRTRTLGRSAGWVQMAIVRRSDGVLLGDCSCNVAGDPPRTAEIGITLDRAHQGHGYAREAWTALIATLFADHGMHRVIARVDDRNVAVHRLVERLGLRLEARLVEADWFKGSWATLRIYAVLAREWDGRRAD